MITENYVSFEVAKLLKENGFDEKCIAVYHDKELQLVSSLGIFSSEGYGEQILTYTNSECEWSPIMISAPTLQMAMKWLREEYNWHIEICRGPKGYHIWIVTIPLGVTKYITEEVCGKGIKYLDTYEEACEAGIRYCIKSLI